jgi:hypothetical protein
MPSRPRVFDRRSLLALALLAAAQATGRPASALPTLVGPGDTCMSCHNSTPASGALSVLLVNGSPAAGPPWGVTVSAGASFSLVYRATGLDSSSSYPDVGGAVVPPDTVRWVVSQGPPWADNGQSGSTPWTAANTLFYRTDYPATDNSFGVAGLTADNGSLTAPVDKNHLASNEVLSANVALGAAVAPGVYTLTLAGVGHSAAAPVAWTQPFSVYVPAPSATATPSSAPTATFSLTDSPSPTPSSTPSLTPSLTPSGTDSPVPAGSSPTDTPAPSATPSASGTASASPTATPTVPTPTLSPSATRSATPGPTVTASPTAPPGAVSGLSFPDVDRLWVGPNPMHGAKAVVHFHLLARADDVRLRLYGPALVALREQDLGPRPGGWNQATLALGGLAPQAYYLVTRVLQGPDDRRSRAFTVFLLP